MKRTPTLSILAFMISISLFLGSWSNNPPDGRTGAPGDGLCSDCHSSPGSFTGNVVISGLPAVVTSNTTYSITVTVNNFDGNAVRAGFQLVALDDNANNMGVITGNAEVASTTVVNGRNYAEHDPAKNFVGDAAFWIFDWTAPNAPGEDVIMYAAGNIANGNGSNSGDVIVTSTATTMVANPLEANIVANDISCNGESDGSASVTATGGVGGYTYLWSNGQNTDMATDLSAGTYTVTVTDGEGNTATDMVTLNDPAPVSPNIIGESFICGNECTNLSTGTFDSYLWSTGETTQSIEACDAGSYGVTVTLNGCEGQAEFVIDVSALSIELVSSSEANCSSCDGTAIVSASGGAGSYTYAWSNGFEGTLPDNLCGGITIVTVTDGEGCTATLDVNIGNVSTLEIESLTATNLLCQGDAGTATVTATGGEMPYAYAWSSGETESTITTFAGNYTVTVTDANGCIAVETVSVVEPDEIIINIVNITPDFSNGGSATISVTGGTEPYSYSWTINNSEISTDMNLEDAMFGEYIITVMDANGCSATNIVLIDDFTDVEDISLSKQISLFPNPAQSKIYLNIEDINDNNAHVIIMDIGGREISKQVLTQGNNRIDTSSFTKGMYFFKILIDGRFITKKVLINKKN